MYVTCTDEKSGIQALEHKYPRKPMRPGQIARLEFEYIRHGTQCLIANFQVATGQVIAPPLGPTRKEDDFVAHIRQTVATAPDAGWIFITDRLDIHMSASLVTWVAATLGDPQDLGKKEKYGILQSTKTRMAYLTDESHRIRFDYAPKHASWLNQVELWFSILVRRLLKRGSFTSVHDLRARILRFIDNFNRTLAKPFKWTYQGKVLAA
ncbi:MAG: transposase [Armatimonadota bacterium]